MTRIRDEGFPPRVPRQATHGSPAVLHKSTYDAIARQQPMECGEPFRPQWLSGIRGIASLRRFSSGEIQCKSQQMNDLSARPATR